jgi:hypothetical protein
MQAQIKLDGADTRIVVGGVDVADQVRGLRLDAEPLETRLTLDIVVFETEVDGEMTVEIPEGTRDLLLHLGWTPPTEDE